MEEFRKETRSERNRSILRTNAVGTITYTGYHESSSLKEN